MTVGIRISQSKVSDTGHKWSGGVEEPRSFSPRWPNGNRLHPHHRTPRHRPRVHGRRGNTRCAGQTVFGVDRHSERQAGRSGYRRVHARSGFGGRHCAMPDLMGPFSGFVPGLLMFRYRYPLLHLEGICGDGRVRARLWLAGKNVEQSEVGQVVHGSGSLLFLLVIGFKAPDQGAELVQGSGRAC